MRDLKIKHYSLFAATFLVLWLAEIPGGPILLILVWQQMALYLWQTEFNKKSQIDCLVHSLMLIPLFFFLGAVAAFVAIHLRELNWLSLLFSTILNFIVAFLLILFGISFYLDYKSEATLYGLYIEAIKKIKDRKIFLLKLTGLFVLITLMLQLFSIDYAIVAAYAIVHFMGKTYSTKLGFADSTKTASLQET